VVSDAAVRDVLEQQAERGSAAVVLEGVALHRHVLGVHHGYARIVRAEDVVAVRAPVAEHEMQAVTQVRLGVIPFDPAVLDELEVDAVAMTAHVVVADLDLLRVPEMDAVAGRRLATLLAAQDIALDEAPARIREVDAEERI